MANRYPFQPSQSQQHMNMIQPNVPGFSGINMWPQHQQLADEQKQREYLKQQQKLRLMASGNHKQPVSADKLIENLLEKEDTFKLKVTPQPIPPGAMSTHQTPVRSSGNVAYTSSHASILPSADIAFRSSQSTKYKGGFGGPETSSQTDLIKSPSWLFQSASLPPLYSQVWAGVGQEGLVDTTKIFPVLLTSGLPTDVLGYIWGLANQKIAGQLTEEELYIVLALVALAQNGCAFNNLSILNLIPQAPVPNLNLSTLNIAVPQETELGISQLGKMRREELNLQDTVLPSVSTVGKTSSQTSINENEDSFDEFTDFQSATCDTSDVIKGDASSTSTEPVASVSNTNSLPDPVTHKFPSVLVMSNSGRGIGSRLANHSLGTPRQTKTRHHKHHHHHRVLQQPVHNFSPSGEEEFSDFQQAKDPAGGNVSGAVNMFPKCIVKSPPNKMFVLKESAIRTELTLEENKNVCDTGGTNRNPALLSSVPNIPIATKSNFKPIPDDVKSAPLDLATSKELMSVEEDKYSALRALAIANQPISVDKDSSNNDEPSISDDFGDFLSAEIPPTKETNTNENFFHTDEDVIWQSANASSSEFKVDDWGAFESVSTDVSNWAESSHGIVPAMEGLHLKGSDKSSADIKKQQESDASKSADVDGSSSWPVEFHNTQKKNGLSFLGKIYDDGGSNSSLCSAKGDLFSPGNERPIKNNSFEIKNDDDEFGDFIGSDGKYNNKDTLFDNQSGAGIKDAMFDSQSVSSLELPPLALSRHGSLPSLDLKIFPPGGDKGSGHQLWDSSLQVQEWCRCVQSCLQLLQAAVATFLSIPIDEVAEEVVNAHRGREYLQNLLEVFGICQRVKYSSNLAVVDSKQLESLLTDVDSAWANLERCYSKADITTDIEFVSSTAYNNFAGGQDLTTDTFSGGQEHSACGICLTSIGNDIMEHESNMCLLEYGGQVYHAACANLWVNCVDCSLPALASSTALL